MELMREMLTRQRKLTVTFITGTALAAGFGVVVWRPAALEAYRVFAEWAVYLTAFFAGANAVTYWTQRAGTRPPTVK